MDVNSGLMHSLGKSLLAFGQIDTIEDIHNSIDEISSKDLQEIGLKYMGETHISTLIFDLKD